MQALVYIFFPPPPLHWVRLRALGSDWICVVQLGRLDLLREVLRAAGLTRLNWSQNMSRRTFWKHVTKLVYPAEFFFVLEVLVGGCYSFIPR